MDQQQPETELEIVREIAADLRGQLDQVEDQMATLTRENKRALVLRQVFDGDPLTRDRFNMLHAAIDQYPGKMAELREEQRLLTRWLERCRDMLQDRAA
jgi:hypothetical protein